MVVKHGDLTDRFSLSHLPQQVRLDAVYDLGAQSRVAVNFESPKYTAGVDGWERCTCWRRSTCWGCKSAPASARLPPGSRTSQESDQEAARVTHSTRWPRGPAL
ncbi:GDP-mannose 4,6-dehydratase [Rubrivivax sp. RP6-9]|uniref:GDP-mannose 4,6-dehydratase n=1 Tax=Rubrivivax sp. RP6-9 TaxID=3415750 RepID=UPI003CC6CC72